jgi:hypothetical protein
VDREIINFYLDVVQELIDRGVPATVENINKHLAPANKEADIIEALDTLVSEGRLVKSPAASGAAKDEDFQIVKG